MDFDRSLILAYLEEDNIQRAYFRVLPLLTLEGDIRQEAMKLWPSEGALRIVPDRNEQHTFKGRMRSLGAYCVVDLRNQPTEAGKIRTNKNFRPDKGEVNQYILYSDTVHELPPNTFYHLIDGSPQDYAALSEQAITPMFYIRHNDVLYGPISKSTPEQPEPACEATALLFEIPCPDQKTRCILCLENELASTAPTTAAENPSAEAANDIPGHEKSADDNQLEAASQQPDSSSECLPIGETLLILDQKQSHEDTLKQLDKPLSSSANLLKEEINPESTQIQAPFRDEHLSGTPLVHTPLHVSVQRTKNRTQEYVSSQLNIGKYEPPAPNLPAGTKMRTVENPIETACAYLKDAWNATSAHDQLSDFMLSLDGIQNILETKLCEGKSITIMQRVLRDRLKDLEAERLTALCELDKARRDVDAYKQELIQGLASRIRTETSSLEASRNQAQEQLDTLKDEINGLTHQRDALLSKVNELQSQVLPETIAKLAAEAHMTAPISGTPLRMSPIAGSEISEDALIERMVEGFASSGFEIDRNTAIALLALLAISSRIGISCPTPAPLATLLRNITHAMGWEGSYAHQISSEQRPMAGMRPINGTPAILATSLPNFSPLPNVTKLTINRTTANLIRNAAYDACQWPIIELRALPFVPLVESAAKIPVSASSFDPIRNRNSVETSEFSQLLTPIFNAAYPLSGAARNEMFRFVSICAAWMDGGLPSAIDWAIQLWIVPALERGTKQHSAVKTLLDEYPLSLGKM